MKVQGMYTLLLFRRSGQHSVSVQFKYRNVQGLYNESIGDVYFAAVQEKWTTLQVHYSTVQYNTDIYIRILNVLYVFLTI